MLPERWNIAITEESVPFLRVWLDRDYPMNKYKLNNIGQYFYFPNYANEKGFQKGSHISFDSSKPGYTEISLKTFKEEVLNMGRDPQPLIYF